VLIVFSTIFIAYTIVVIIVFILFYFRRNLQPLKSRSPQWIVFSTIFAYAMVAHTCFAEIFSPRFYFDDAYPCTLFIYWSYFCTPPVLYGYYVRCWKLYLIFNINLEKVRLIGTNFPEFAKRNMLEDKYVLKFLWIPFSISLFIGLMIHGLDYHFDGSQPCPKVTLVTVLYGILMLMIFALLAIVYKLRKVDDGYSIKKELQLNSLSWTILGSLFFIFYAIFRKQVEVVLNNSLPSLVLILLLVISTCISCIWPLYLTYSRYWNVSYRIRNQSQSIVDLNTSLKRTIEDTIGRKFFLEFLVSEFCAENLLFWMAAFRFKNLETGDENIDVTTFTRATDIETLEQLISVNPTSTKSEDDSSFPPDTISFFVPKTAEGVTDAVVALTQVSHSDYEIGEVNADKIKEIADIIYTYYIKVGAPLEVNLSDTVRVEMKKRMDNKEYSLTMFEEAEKAVYKDMSRNSFPRFLLSERFKEYEKKNEQETNKEIRLLAARLI